MFGITSPQMEAFDDLGASRLDAHMVQTIGNALPDLLREQSPDQRRQQLAAWVG